MNKIFFLLLVVLIIPLVESQQSHLTLLAVKETEAGIEGSTADLFLEIREGTGRVFLDTFPLTKVDTQISNRFAKEIACNFLDKDCRKQDFIYTIQADSSIIAGPSAGAAASVLTAAALAGLEVNQSVAITGTINSGGLIGHVGGIKEKIDAAAASGIKKVLIPKGEDIVELVDNFTVEEKIPVQEYSKLKNIEIQEVTTLNDAIFEFTGRRYKEEYGELVVDEKYGEIMSGLALDLCNRTSKIWNDIENLSFGENYSKEKEEALNFTQKGKEAFESSKFYSAASYCFGANVKLSYLYMVAKNFSDEDIIKGTEIVEKGIEALNKRISDKKILTITDLESYAAVKERLLEARNNINESLESLEEWDNALYNLAYASERVYSALSWYEFFVNYGKRFDLEKEKIKASCLNKILEAEERYQYIKLLFPALLGNTKQEIDYAYSYLYKKEYELCLFKASIAKAQADIVLNLIGLNENKTKDQLNTKLEIVKRNIIKDSRKGIFPIMSYSYYEYANSLKGSDLYSALLYAEYALELSNFNMYFESLDRSENVFSLIDERYLIFVLGIAVGLIPYVMVVIYKKPRRKSKKR